MKSTGILFAPSTSHFGMAGTKIRAERRQAMGHAEQLSQVRHVVREKFLSLGALPDSEVTELVLIRDGQYCGRKFLMVGMGVQAIWFCEEDQLKIYSPESGTVEVVVGLSSGPRMVVARAA
jgi:hypothetical protein